MSKLSTTIYVPDRGWSRAARLAVKATLNHLPDGIADFLYSQIKGSCRRLGVPEAPQRVRLKLPGEIELSLDLGDGTQRNIYYCGFYERHYQKCLARYLSAGDTFIDIGANAGFYTVWAAKTVGPQGAVFSFDPNPIAFKCLAENVRLNGFTNVVLQNIALGDRSHTAFLTLSAGSTAISRLVSDTVVASEDVVTVPVKTLDSCLEALSLLSDTGRKVNLIKMDAEGAEMSILKGANTLLTIHSRPYIMCEVDDRHLTARGSSARELIEHLRSLDYIAFRVVKGGNLAPLGVNALPQRTNPNLFFIPKEKHAR